MTMDTPPYVILLGATSPVKEQLTGGATKLTSYPSRDRRRR
ncbi:hypothetical protein Pan216_03370 [Planctomycetes bacterium Pan216]|uniref:Uncharacterized protein n=1 Tax=Kolteria novifilia TaxID=2527975 RepID=A0A518AXQ3_9BACT|nr:hypothetical protein Pan216_03370 [Planctomycetes bacterium Pan216]